MNKADLRQAVESPEMHFFEKMILTNAMKLDPVDVLNDLEHAVKLWRCYAGGLLADPSGLCPFNYFPCNGDYQKADYCPLNTRDNARKRKFVVLSGPARFVDAWGEWRTRIIQRGDLPYSGRSRKSNRRSSRFLTRHTQAIIREYADELLVLNVGGYIGPSTQAEIDIAVSKGIPVNYIEGGKI